MTIPDALILTAGMVAAACLLWRGLALLAGATGRVADALQALADPEPVDGPRVPPAPRDPAHRPPAPDDGPEVLTDEMDAADHAQNAVETSGILGERL